LIYLSFLSVFLFKESFFLFMDWISKFTE